jgi:hypothetical protein
VSYATAAELRQVPLVEGAKVRRCAAPHHRKLHSDELTDLCFWKCSRCKRTFCSRCSGGTDFLPCDDCWHDGYYLPEQRGDFAACRDFISKYGTPGQKKRLVRELRSELPPDEQVHRAEKFAKYQEAM